MMRRRSLAFSLRVVFMPRANGGFNFDGIARRWLALADRRLLYFSQLYRSGRWTRYYASPEQFAAQMHKAIKAAQMWARLAGARGGAGDGKNDPHPAE
jgi:hypothetical protein